MKETLTESQVRGILQSIEDALEKGPWDESNFLRAIGKNIKDIRDNLAKEIEKTYSSSANASSKSSKKEQQIFHGESEKEVFISLYSADGLHIHTWERILINLPRQIVSRPIYDEEDDVRAFIKSKENKFNEAYVGIYIDVNDILKLSAEKIAIDKFGKPLMALKDRAINLENITRFVHVSGSYTYSKGHLHKMGQ
jgi:intracellular multiplication protein IcmQ